MDILITDDHALFRDGLKYVLRQLDNNMIIFEAGNCDEAVQIATEQQQLDLILLDLVMSGTNGIAALKMLRNCAPSIPIVIVSGTEDRKTVKNVLDCGAQGFIPKSSSSEVMLGALHLVLSGGIYLPALLLNDSGKEPSNELMLNNEVDGGHEQPTSPPVDHGLTLRQLEVLSLLCRGLSNKEISRTLSLAEGTVKIHVTAILKTLQVTSRTQAVIAAQGFGLTGETH